MAAVPAGETLRPEISRPGILFSTPESALAERNSRGSPETWIVVKGVEAEDEASDASEATRRERLRL